MVLRRVICCLDIRDGRVVKGRSFENLRDMGDPVERAQAYMNTGADELCFLDITASIENRPLLLELVERLSKVLFIPFTVGGGIRSIDDARALLRAGADKIALNTAAIKDPDLIAQLADEFGSQCVVLSVDTRRRDDRWIVTTHGARQDVQANCLQWVTRGYELGAGEILLNVIDTDGHRDGFAIEITSAVCDAVPLPVIASGGAGLPKHFVEVFQETGATAALAASMFHDNSFSPNDVKQELERAQIAVRS